MHESTPDSVCLHGMAGCRYRGAKIQLLDLPGIIEGAKDGKGRGRQVRRALVLAAAGAAGAYLPALADHASLAPSPAPARSSPRPAPATSSSLCWTA